MGGSFLAGSSRNHPISLVLGVHLGSFNGSGRPAAFKGMHHHHPLVIRVRFHVGGKPSQRRNDGRDLGLYPRFFQDRQIREDSDVNGLVLLLLHFFDKQR